MIGVGMKVCFVPYFLDDKKSALKDRREAAVTAEVAYINWEHRYFTAEWTEGGNTFRESFKFHEIGKNVTVCGTSR